MKKKYFLCKITKTQYYRQQGAFFFIIAVLLFDKRRALQQIEEFVLEVFNLFLF